MSFSTWLNNRVEVLRSQNVVVSPEIRNLDNEPKSEVEEYMGMSAYANYYRVENPVEGNPYKTYDSGVACIATTLCQFSANDPPTRSGESKICWCASKNNPSRLQCTSDQCYEQRLDQAKCNIKSHRTEGCTWILVDKKRSLPKRGRRAIHSPPSCIPGILQKVNDFFLQCIGQYPIQ